MGFRIVAKDNIINDMNKESSDTRHFRLAMESFIGKDKRHNQTTLAEASGVPRSLINEILHQKRFAGRVAQQKIARACGASLADFLAIGQVLDNNLADSPEGVKAPSEVTPPSVSPDQPASPVVGFIAARHFQLGLREYIQRDQYRARNKNDLARLSGIDRKLLNAVYLCRKAPDLATMEAIAKAVNIPLEAFLESGRQREGKYSPVNEAEIIKADTAGLAGRPTLAGPPVPIPLDEPSEAVELPALPIIGMGTCGRAGWKRHMPMSSSASIPTFGPRSFVAIAEGFSMVPAGIGTGMFCYCDPDVAPIKGDAVYIYNKLENISTIKEFVGWGRAAGTKPDHLKVRGWKDPDQWKRQEEFFLEIPKDQVTEIATVICVRRRM